jgi:hypothetical protein
MTWTIEYYEQENAVQPAEIFEDALKHAHPKLAGKLRRVLVAVQDHGRQLGGGLIEPLHGYPGLWEARTIFSGMLAREFFAWDGDTAILLHGYVKRVREPASQPDMQEAQTYWQDYQKNHRISPEEPEALEPSDESQRFTTGTTATRAPDQPPEPPEPPEPPDKHAGARAKGKEQTR